MLISICWSHRILWNKLVSPCQDAKLLFFFFPKPTKLFNENMFSFQLNNDEILNLISTYVYDNSAFCKWIISLVANINLINNGFNKNVSVCWLRYRVKGYINLPPPLLYFVICSFLCHHFLWLSVLTTQAKYFLNRNGNLFYNIENCKFHSLLNSLI